MRRKRIRRFFVYIFFILFEKKQKERYYDKEFCRRMVMDFKSLKDVNTSKALLKEIYDSFLAEIKKAKDIDINAIKKGFDTYFVTFF